MPSSDDIKIIIQDDAQEQLKSVAYQKRVAYKEDLHQQLENDKITTKEKRKIQNEYNRLDREDQIEKTRQDIDNATTYKAKKDAQERLKKLEEEKRDDERREQNAKKTADAIAQSLLGAVDKVYNSIGQAAKTYSSYVDKIQVRLLGANETVGSISDTLSRAFGASPFFQMKNIMDKAAQAVEKGISFNIEARTAMQVLSEKVAATFDAFDSSLLRLIRIQQQDSTQARLGMESMLTEFLNRNFQDTSYLADNINAAVTSALLEAESLYARETSVQLEYSIQKWLSSLYSVGVSNNLVNQLAQGLGYLASGDVSALSGNSSLEQLLVVMANRGGANYGDILTGGMSVDDVSLLFNGLRSLIEEISSQSTNIVALNQYAKVFGMTVSDVQSLLNLSDNAMKEIASDMQTYQSLTQRVVSESTFDKLYSRTGGASLGENFYQNFIYGAGKAVGQNAVSYLSWQLGDLVAGMLGGVESGIDIQPFGVGTHMNLSIGELVKIGMASAGSLAGIGNMLSGLSSITGVDLGALSEEIAHDVVVKGNLLSFAQVGERKTQVAYSGDWSEGSLGNVAKEQTESITESYKDENYDEEKQRMENISSSLGDVKEDLQFIAQLLNEDGIVVRGRAGLVSAVSPSEDIFSDNATSYAQSQSSYFPQTQAATESSITPILIGARPI